MTDAENRYIAKREAQIIEETATAEDLAHIWNDPPRVSNRHRMYVQSFDVNPERWAHLFAGDHGNTGHQQTREDHDTTPS